MTKPALCPITSADGWMMCSLPAEHTGPHDLRSVHVGDAPDTRLEDKNDDASRWNLARPSSPGGVIFVHDGPHFGSPEIRRTFMANNDHDAERLAVLLERSDRIADSMREAGYFGRGRGGLFSGGVEHEIVALRAALNEALDLADTLSNYIALDNPYANVRARRARIAELRKIGA